MKKIIQTVLALALLIPAMAIANLCDDVHALANRWHSLATAIHERTHEELSAAARKKLAQEDRLLIPPSRKLVEICKTDPERRVQSLGKQLSALLDEYASLNDNDSWDEDVKVIDKMVGVLDELTKICDAAR